MSHHDHNRAHPEPSEGDKVKMLLLTIVGTFAAAGLVKFVGDLFLGH